MSEPAVKEWSWTSWSPPTTEELQALRLAQEFALYHVLRHEGRHPAFASVYQHDRELLKSLYDKLTSVPTVLQAHTLPDQEKL